MIPLLILLLVAPQALAWNGAGHRLVAAIAWRQMTPASRHNAGDLLARHPHWSQWTAKAKGVTPDYAAFLEASTWADDIRKDPRYSDEGSLAPSPALPGLTDTARHKNWHYADFTDSGGHRDGELDQQIERLSRLLRDPHQDSAAKVYALPWLIHLVGDIHQPLHVGSRDDEGGNQVEIEDPFTPRYPFTTLHRWWDDLPGPPWLRGQRLETAADALVAAYPPPRQGNTELWREESRLLSRSAAYPRSTGSLLPTIDATFRDTARETANRRLAEAGYRLGRLLNRLLDGVPRETE